MTPLPLRPLTWHIKERFLLRTVWLETALMSELASCLGTDAMVTAAGTKDGEALPGLAAS